MSSPTILAYLVKKFTNQVENLATDALFYIITQYPQAKDAFIFYINQIGTTIPDNLKFKTQVTWEDNAIPDMVGLNDEDHQVLIIESKFWAYLTPNQPITYINRLPSHPGGIVLFIVPSRRIHGLWIELLQRCAAEGLLSGEPREITPDLFVVEAGRNKFLAVSTWQSILSKSRKPWELQANTMDYPMFTNFKDFVRRSMRMSSNPSQPIAGHKTTIYDLDNIEV